MIPKISHYLNRTVMVSVPGLFDDGVCRPFTLLGADLNGLWLQSDELTRRLLPHDGPRGDSVIEPLQSGG